MTKHVDCVRLLLGLDRAALNKAGQTALEMDEETLRRALAAPEPSRLFSTNADKSVCEAAESGELQDLERLLTGGASPNATAANGSTA